ncbi:alpha/beta hydrolase [Kribbella sandramycini]|uniref:Alpha/beta hydrolase n=1 Tax=Kribbella sandramycini TaxID=60450 RepID=A0A7Y4NZ64_9ACTN|nr:alpha/beta hydrolase [Kribbella sandramycini]MBB6567536.1 pimeloyl-ACP methyl ester carboxylesterase [Kribbella sandramycini]NOL39860.1 alpha/beta hydrolase [Kribbella sandramycini]
MPSTRSVRLNGLDIHLAEQGSSTDPLVVLLHGFPETSYSWRHQLDALAAAGYRVVAPDQRGYGASDRPAAIDQYSIFHLVGDVVALIRELGSEQAVVVGHDWGSIVAWNTALLRPDVVRGVVGISVPPWPRGALPPLTVTEQRFGPDFYQNYFQEPGVADAELEKDIASTLRRVYAGVPDPDPAPGFAGRFLEPTQLPAWLTEQDLAVFVDQFTASGFTGGLNYYRNLDRNWEQTAAWQDAPITPPSLYISGLDDAVRTMYPLDDAARAVVPNLRAAIDVPNCGHWTQQEQPAVVNAALLDFLREL